MRVGIRRRDEGRDREREMKGKIRKIKTNRNREEASCPYICYIFSKRLLLIFYFVLHVQKALL